MKLNPEELVVSSFETADPAAASLPTADTNDPTPATHCYWCPPPTVGTEPGTVVVTE